MSLRSGEVRCYRAAWLLPLEGDPIQDEIISLDDHQILAIGKNLSDNEPTVLKDTVLTPGLINLHTHLEFSGIKEPLGSAAIPFTSWIPQVIQYRRNHGELWESKKQKYIEQGLHESVSTGVSLLGEISTLPYHLNDYQNSHTSVCSFLELIGRGEDSIDSLMQAAQDHLQTCQQHDCLPGISPHAPYSVHPEVVKQVAQLSQQDHFPVAMHLAESEDELELISNHTGNFREMLEGFNLWNEVCPSVGTSIQDYLCWLSPSYKTLVIHGNLLSQSEIQYLSEHQEKFTVVYCPRTHAYFGHRTYPLHELIEAQVPLAIGTDSRASSPNLNLWQDVQFAANKFPEVPEEQWLPMVTKVAAQGLGVDHTYGTLAAGKSAKLTCFQLNKEVHDLQQVYRELLKADARSLFI